VSFGGPNPTCERAQTIEAETTTLRIGPVQSQTAPPTELRKPYQLPNALAILHVLSTKKRTWQTQEGRNVSENSFFTKQLATCSPPTQWTTNVSRIVYDGRGLALTPLPCNTFSFNARLDDRTDSSGLGV
jgi:hypothetical protein